MQSGVLAELSESQAAEPVDDGAARDQQAGEGTAFNASAKEKAGLGSAELVLIVEDTHDMRKFIYFLLQPHYRLITARNGEEGLAKAREHKPDIILSDVMMPRMNGYQLLTAVKQDPELQSIPVILLTAKADITMKIEGLDLGADDYVVKPFNSKELLSRVKSHLRMAAMQAEIRTMRDQLLELNEKLSGQLQAQVSELIRSSKFQSYLPPQLVHSILDKNNDDQVRSSRKKMTIFFSDIVNFTGITEDLEPEELAELLNSYLSEMTAIATEHGATIDKFVGDAILCHFGDLHSKGEKADAVACVGMAVAMQLRMRALSAVWIERGYSEPLQIRCGINTGFVAVGNFGSDKRLDYTVIGSHVNLASRLESSAEPGQILVSHSTWALVREDFQLEPFADIAVKGFARQIPTYQVRL